MKHLCRWLALTCCCVAFSAGAAPIRVLGIDSGTTWDYSNIEQGKISNVLFTEVSITDFATVNLNDYDVLMVSETFTDSAVTLVATATLSALKARETQISAWVAAGHGLLVLSEPIGAGRWDWLPDSIQPVVGGSPIHDDSLNITNPLHPVMAGLTSSALSSWGTSSHGNVISTPGLDVLVDDGAGRAITSAGVFGSGRVVLTLQDPDFHNFYNPKPGQAMFVQNAINWVSVSEPIEVPEPGSLALATFGLAGLSIVRRRRKS